MITEQPAPATGAAGTTESTGTDGAAQPAAVPLQPAAVPLPTPQAPPTAPGAIGRSGTADPGTARPGDREHADRDRRGTGPAAG
jgi:hypothetical protein